MKKITFRVKLLMGTDSFIMKLFHFVRKKRLKDWLEDQDLVPAT
jgi:hypothetical protein